MAVDSVEYTDAGTVRAEVVWFRAPELTFNLEVSGDGRVLEFRARAGAGGSISARRLRVAPIGEMQRAIRNYATSADEAFREDDPDDETSTDARATMLRKLAQDFLDRGRPGAAGRGDAQYAAIAAGYVGMLDAGEAHPVAALAADLSLSEKTIRNYLFKARERGLLTSLGRGKAGGQLTNKAKEILDGHHQAP